MRRREEKMGKSEKTVSGDRSRNLSLFDVN